MAPPPPSPSAPSHHDEGGTGLRARLDETVAALRSKVPGPAGKPRLGLVLGSGLGAFADTLEGLVKIPFGDVPHLPVSRVVGHAGNMCFGASQGVALVCMQGRVHAYEGHGMAAVVHGVRTMARMGVEAVLLTNAAGGLEPSWSAGDLMLIEDHINLSGMNPLLGPNDDVLGPRFPDMTEAYDRRLREACQGAAEAAGIPLRKGVYVCLSGPTYETPSEVRMVRGLGGHAVGMSTVAEVIALRHMGVAVAALSCITNMAAGITGQALSHAEVEETARARRDDLLALLRGWIARTVASP